MRTIDNMKKRLDSLMINRINERLITWLGNRLYEWLIEMPYLRLSGLLDDKIARCMTGQSFSHSNIQTFKHSNINTVLSVTVIKGGHTVTDIQGLWEAFGTGAFLEWSWRREEDEEFGLLSVMDSRLSNAGFTLTVSPDDVDEKTIFMCAVHA